MTSPQAQWQRGMMAFDPSTCWCFVAPDRVCVRARPCPLHERAEGGTSAPPESVSAMRLYDVDECGGCGKLVTAEHRCPRPNANSEQRS